MNKGAIKYFGGIRARCGKKIALVLCTVWLSTQFVGFSQGTLTFTFEGAPFGTRVSTNNYLQAGMNFSVIAPGQLFLNGGGILGSPSNGTGYLEVPDAFVGGGGLTFGFTNFLPSTYFNLVSFDAAAYGGLGPQTIEVIGYPGMAAPVTNFFTATSQFQTFTLDSSFAHVGRVDMLNARISLDNVFISGVPEPSACALLSLSTALTFSFRRTRRPSRR